LKWWYPAWARDDWFSQAVEVTAERGHIDMISQLVEAGVDFEDCIGIHGGALEEAVFKGYENKSSNFSSQQVRQSISQQSRQPSMEGMKTS